VESSLIIFTAAGAAASWIVKGRRKLKLVGLSDLCNGLKLGRARPWVEFVVFIALGVFIGIAFADPKTSNQAMTAGLGWTGLMTQAEQQSARKPVTERKPKRSKGK
jgi:hypothetical protein